MRANETRIVIVDEMKVVVSTTTPKHGVDPTTMTTYRFPRWTEIIVREFYGEHNLFVGECGGSMMTGEDTINEYLKSKAWPTIDQIDAAVRLAEEKEDESDPHGYRNVAPH